MFRVIWTDTGEPYTSDTFDAGGDAATVSKDANTALREAGDARRTRVERFEPETEPENMLGAYGQPHEFRTYGGPVLFYRADDYIRNWLTPLTPYGQVPEDGPRWRLREHQRKVLRPSWLSLAWYTQSEHAAMHYPYVSEIDPSKLCYTQSEAHGRKDRQTRTTPGRYLAKYFGEVLSSDEIRELALQWSVDFAPRELRLATTPNEIEYVYVNGPNSCMSHDADEYSTPEHPVRAYGAGDLAIAYITDDADHGHIVARGICWPDKGTYTGRGMYGDSVRLAGALEQAGYTTGMMDGARLLRIEFDGGKLVCPWLDIASYVGDNGDYLIVGGGDYCARNTEGYIGDAGHMCERCDEGYDPEYEGRPVAGENWCEHCVDNYAFGCEDCGEMYHVDTACTVIGRYGETYVCEGCAENCTECEDCGDAHDSDNVTEAPDGRAFCDSCYADNVIPCEACGDDVMHDATDDNGECPDCAEAEDAEDDDTENPTRRGPRNYRPVPDSTDPMQYVMFAPWTSRPLVVRADGPIVVTLLGYRFDVRTGVRTDLLPPETRQTYRHATEAIATTYAA